MNANTNDTALLRLEGEMTIGRAAELRQMLLDGLAGLGRVDLDLSEVEEIDSTGVQLIIAARKHARLNGRALHIVACSDVVKEAMKLLAIAPCMDIGPQHCSHCESLEKCYAAWTTGSST